MMASFDICRGKSEGAKDEALLLEINKQLDDTRTDLAETRTLLTKAMAKADEVENELRAAEAELAEAATQSGVSVCISLRRPIFIPMRSQSIPSHSQHFSWEHVPSRSQALPMLLWEQIPSSRERTGKQ